MANTNLKMVAYDKIKKMIIEGELEGGSPIQELKLVDVIGVSRTPIREACNLLQHEHLVEIYPKQGVFVTRISYKDVIDIYSVRIELESYAVEIATKKMNQSVKEDLYEKWLKLDQVESFPEHIINDKDLHSKIAKSTTNKYLIQYLERLYDQTDRIRYYSLNKSESRLQQTQTEHLRMLQNMVKGNAKDANLAMREHLIRARDTALQFFE